jgi:arginyl-tRNA synthetase
VECREWSYAYFRAFYERVQVAPFDAYYPESETTAPGLQIVNEHRGDVFSDSDGAVIFAGKTADLHTRVFITSKGLPTYETKDLGVILTEYADFTYDERFIMTGNDQAAYMQVVFAALAAFNPDLAARQHHLVHGTIRFGDGKKMSSRLGNVLTAHEVIAEVGATVTGADDTIRDQITLGAIKYSFLKHRLGGDIAFDISESVSLEGNSGPYLQYAHARARSILRKAPRCPTTLPDTIVFSPYERVLARTLANFHEEVEQAAAEQLPHYICTYLYELAQVFNRFYEHEQVIGSDAEGQRIVLVCAYADTLQAGLTLLGIVAPDTM